MAGGTFDMRYRMMIALAAASVLGVLGGLLGIANAEMQCGELESGEALCDDGAQMYYRAEPSAPFVLLDEDSRQKVLAHLAGGAEPGDEPGGSSPAPPADDPAGTSFFGSTGSITSDGDCVSLSAPGVSFMGSGC